MTPADLNPDRVPARMPEGVCGEVLAAAYGKVERQLLLPSACPEARQLARDSYLHGVRVLYRFLHCVLERPQAAAPFALVFEQLGHELERALHPPP